MAGQEVLVHFVIASSTSFTSFELHSGQDVGKDNLLALLGRSSGIMRTTSGIISPALRMIIVSPW